MLQEKNLQYIIAHVKTYGFIYPSSEIYSGLNAIYDYAPLGHLLKRNVQNLWLETMLKAEQEIVSIDSSILMHPKIWEASGHINNFHDFLIDNKDSKKRYRVDVLIEAHAEELYKKGDQVNAERILEEMHTAIGKNDPEALTKLIQKENMICPVAKNNHFTPVRKFNLMFSTQGNASAEKTTEIYLRPETAQGIFVNFLQVQKSLRLKIPFGIAQIGKAFRNEIIARQFIFRMREFEQMEMQFFIEPSQEKYWFEYWRNLRMKWFNHLGIPLDHLKFKVHENLAHYASAAVDITYKFPFGYQEVEGIHARTDFDLKNHQLTSNKKLQYFDPALQKSYLPYVIETSLGCDRFILMLLCESFVQDQNPEKPRTYLAFNPLIAPIKGAILPLVKKDGLKELAKKIFNELKYDHMLMYDDMGSIGKRYTRQDLLGTPFCFTVDHQTLEDDTVTIRNRDDLSQKRIAIAEIKKILNEQTNLKNFLKKIA